MSQEDQKCQLCYDGRIGINNFFAKCQHKGVCLKCCQKYLIQAIKYQKIPKCPICQQAVMMQQEKNCTYQYLPDNLKNQWKKAKIKIYRKFPTQPCRVPDCQGIIKGGKCLKCCQFYCEKCYNFQHVGKCKQEQEGQQNLGDIKIKKCPKCSIPIQHVGGCLKITCKCKHQFCFICLQDWTPTHHLNHGTQGVRRGIAGWFAQVFGCCGAKKKPKRNNKK